MMNFIRRLFQALLIVAAQVFVFNHLSIQGYGTPILLPLFLVSLPLNTSRSAAMLWAFAMAFVCDVFAGTPGVGTASMVLTAFLQKPLLQIYVPKESPEDLRPTFHTMGTWSHFRYMFVLFFLNHTTFHLLQYFSFHDPLQMLISWGSGLLASLCFASMIEYVRAGRRQITQ